MSEYAVFHRSESHRPRFHFTPRQNWMNDPNGLVCYDGEYHLFYQHNPYGKEWGHMSWGHAFSRDLVHWKDLPVAILEEPENSFTIFSGSAVVDWRHTSGFGQAARPPLVAVYTADHRPRKALQDIHIAYSIDRGRTFQKHAGNPVLDVGDRKFGDPKVFWHEETARWIMVNIRGRGQGRAVLYGSNDLKRWEFLSEFRAPRQAPGTWECPDLFPLPLDGRPEQIKWVLKANCVGGETGRRASRYFVGDFDGQRFRNEILGGRALWPDRGDIYAEVTWNDIPKSDGRRILIGWIPQRPSETRSWTGMQSIPRVLTLRSTAEGIRLCQAPIAELRVLRSEHTAFGSETISGDPVSPAERGISGSELEIVTQFEPNSASEFGLQIELEAGKEAFVGYSVASGELYVHQSGRNRLVAPLRVGNHPLKLHLFLDRSVLEVFGGNGEAVITALLDPGSVCEGLSVYARDGVARLVKMDAWRMAPVWT